MTFEEIFNQEGYYVADSFARGCAFYVNSEFSLTTVCFKSKDDIFPSNYSVGVYKGLFEKKYTQCLTRQAIFDYYDNKQSK